MAGIPGRLGNRPNVGLGQNPLQDGRRSGIGTDSGDPVFGPGDVFLMVCHQRFGHGLGVVQPGMEKIAQHHLGRGIPNGIGQKPVLVGFGFESGQVGFDLGGRVVEAVDPVRHSVQGLNHPGVAFIRFEKPDIKGDDPGPGFGQPIHQSRHLGPGPDPFSLLRDALFIHHRQDDLRPGRPFPANLEPQVDRVQLDPVQRRNPDPIGQQPGNQGDGGDHQRIYSASESVFTESVLPSIRFH